MTPNEIKLDQQAKMRRGDLLGHIDPSWARRRYIDEAAPIEELARDFGCSIIYVRRYLQAHDIQRDRGHIYRAGSKPKPRKGVRVAGSRRDVASRKPKFGSAECREKMAAAKRGKTGARSNHWKGGVWIAGDYEMTRVNGRKVYAHRVVAERLLGRPLLTDEQVHHVDQNRRNNTPSNLIVLLSDDHTRLHRAMSEHKILDQRVWLIANQVSHKDLNLYA